ncbi:hypothetical protein ES705_41475 [subsurface metagenome]
MSLLFLKFTGIIDPNPIGDISSALLLLAIFCTLTVAYSGFPAVVDSLNKSIETLEGLSDFMQAQTEAMNESIETLEEIHGFLIEPVPE